MVERKSYNAVPVKGFSQALKVGDMIYVSGTTAWSEDGDFPKDMEGQMRKTYATIAQSLAAFGATLGDVVEQTVFVTDMDAALAARHVRNEVYAACGDAFPASATVGVTRLGRPGLLVEIKVSARV
jgi:enamine deaminase RidA (YjgF/YER057c/UK114 family)